MSGKIKEKLKDHLKKLMRAISIVFLLIGCGGMIGFGFYLGAISAYSLDLQLNSRVFAITSLCFDAEKYRFKYNKKYEEK